MKHSLQKTGFTPTPMLAPFRFYKSLSAWIAVSVQGVVFMKKDSETKKPRQYWCRGFTLVEMVIYVTLFALISVLAINATITVMKAFYTLRVEQSINQSATTALERMSREIRNAYGVDTVNSTLDASPGHLTLLTTDDANALTTTEFYVTAGNQIGMKVGGVDQGLLVSKTITATNLVFTLLTNANSKAVRVQMTLRDSRSTSPKTVNFYDTIVLRGSIQ